MAKWDLSTTIALYLDRHLVFPFLEFLEENQLYDANELKIAKCELSKQTLMAEFRIDVFKDMHPGEPIPEELVEHRRLVFAKVTKSFEITKCPRELLENTMENKSLMEQFMTSRDVGRVLLDYLVKTCNFKPEWIEDIYLYAKEQYECGNYQISAHYLHFCQLFSQPTMEKNILNILWGKLASEILMQNWDDALSDFTRLKEYIDNNNFGSSLIALQQRTWLINWSLFVFYNHPKGCDLLIDMYLYQQQYLNAIQTTCPHILRYLTVTVITNKQRRSIMKELVKVIQQESYHYRDPITEFVECLYVNFDFDGAQKKLRECEEVLNGDFFLISFLDDFTESARMVIFETFCCIHQCISITMLADKLNMTPEAAEKWIVNLIRNARLDAKIDSRLGHVVMGVTTLSPYQQLIEKTKVLSFRTQVLASNLEKKVASNVPERVPYWAASEF